jgi:Fe-S-cluster containining protein
MDLRPQLDAGDRAFVQVVDAAFAEAARRSGEWLVCRPGCTACCMGPFAINPLDVRRLKLGLEELERRDPPRAARVRERALEAWRRIAPTFPGDASTGALRGETEDEDRFEKCPDDPCPALDSETAMCDLYAARPLTCRIFGPPLRCGDESLGVCELCYHGATDEEIAACEIDFDPAGAEDALLDEIKKAEGARGETIVAYCLGPGY